MRLYIGNLSYAATDDDLREAFARYGRVIKVAIPVHGDTHKPRGFGFVDMPSTDEAETAIHMLDGAKLLGRAITVAEARPRQDHRPAVRSA